jgi:hypothetical protein
VLAFENGSKQREPPSQTACDSINPGNICYDSSPENIFICMGDQHMAEPLNRRDYFNNLFYFNKL